MAWGSACRAVAFLLSLVQPPLYRAKASLEIEALNYNFLQLSDIDPVSRAEVLQLVQAFLPGHLTGSTSLYKTWGPPYPAMSPFELIACGNVPVAEGTSNVGSISRPHKTVGTCVVNIPAGDRSRKIDANSLGFCRAGNTKRLCRRSCLAPSSGTGKALEGAHRPNTPVSPTRNRCVAGWARVVRRCRESRLDIRKWRAGHGRSYLESQATA